jgi:hypothetical protein
LARWATLERFLRQERSVVSPWQGTVDALIRLAE